MRLCNLSNLGALVLALLSSAAGAAPGRHGDRDLSRDVYSYRPSGQTRLPSHVLQCGDTVTTSVALAADLVCPTATGFALNLVGNNLIIDGNGHRIVAPLAAAGLFVQGANNVVRGLRINGVVNGDGIMAYETPSIVIMNNDVSGNLQGIVLYADTGAVAGAQIINNLARNNLLFGIRTGYDAPGTVISPLIRGNDLSGSGSYGMLVKANKFELGGNHANSFLGSSGGIYLAGGDISLHDFALNNDRIQRIGIFADSLDSLTVSNVDVSSNVPGNAAQERIGMDLYRVAHFSINGLNGSANDVGLKFETEGGVNGSGTVTASRFLDDVVSGILVVSYDGTSYGLLQFVQNCFRETIRVLISSGTVVAGGSVTDDGVNICGRSGSSIGGAPGCGSQH